MFRNFRNWCLVAFATFGSAMTLQIQAQPDGATLFKQCATCHQPHKDGTGPKLAGVRDKWASGGALEGSLYQWVKNWEAAAAADPYAKSVSEWSPTAMSKFGAITNEEIDAILDYVDAQPLPGAAAADGGAAGAVVDPAMAQEESSNATWIWLLLGIVFITVILAVGGVRRQLKYASQEAEGKDVKEAATYDEEIKEFVFKNRKWVGIGVLVVVMSLVIGLFLTLGQIGVVEDYQPSQPIDFPHATHAGINGIDCKYCHNSVTKSKSAGLPTVNVCMNCHKQINGNTPEQQEKIAKIYAAAGWDAEKMVYTGKSKEIVWNKVHVLPDHVYFNHSQHVVVGGVDCKQCHGDMTQMKETAKVQPVSELNKVEGNIQLTKPTLTMGWCIECHGEKEIATGPIDSKGDGYYNEIHRRLINNDKSLYGKYLEDGKVTVKELGGWECAKCHY